MYSSNAQPTGTNRPRACPTLTQQDTQTHMCHDDGETALRTRVRVHTQITHRFDHHTPPPARGGTHPGVVVSRQSYGGHSERETPGPIPNPEVKPFSADGTATARSWESRTPPDILCSSPASSEAGLLAFHPQHPRRNGGPRRCGAPPGTRGRRSHAARAGRVRALERILRPGRPPDLAHWPRLIRTGLR